jgi:hypothetical protein
MAVLLITWGVSVAMVAFLTVSDLSLNAPTFHLTNPALPLVGGAPIHLSVPPPNPFGPGRRPGTAPHATNEAIAALLPAPLPPLPPPPPSPTACRSSPKRHRSHPHVREFDCTVPPCVWTHSCHRHHPRKGCHCEGKGWPGLGALQRTLTRLWPVNGAWPMRSEAHHCGRHHGGGNRGSRSKQSG